MHRGVDNFGVIGRHPEDLLLSLNGPAMSENCYLQTRPWRRATLEAPDTGFGEGIRMELTEQLLAKPPMLDPTFPLFQLTELRNSVIVGGVWTIGNEPRTQVSLKENLRDLVSRI